MQQCNRLLLTSMERRGSRLRRGLQVLLYNCLLLLPKGTDRSALGSASLTGLLLLLAMESCSMVAVSLELCCS